MTVRSRYAVGEPISAATRARVVGLRSSSWPPSRRGAALGRLEGAGEDPQEGGLAAAVLAAQHDALARGDREVDRRSRTLPSISLPTPVASACTERGGRRRPRGRLGGGLSAACEHLSPSSPPVCHQQLDTRPGDVGSSRSVDSLMPTTLRRRHHRFISEREDTARRLEPSRRPDRGCRPPQAGGSAHDLFTIRPDGTGRQRLTTLGDHGGSATHADFANDGRSVVFVGVDSAAGLTGVLRVDLASRTVSAALGSRVVMANHPRSRPVRQG